MNPFARNHPKRPSGFTLTEVVIALGLFVFALTAIMGVLPFGMDQVRTASNESSAMSDMESIRDDLSLALSSKMPVSLRYGLATPAPGTTTDIDLLISEDGTPGGNGAAQFRITGTLHRAGANEVQPTHLHLRASWPARAPVGKEAGAVDLVSAFAP